MDVQMSDKEYAVQQLYLYVFAEWVKEEKKKNIQKTKYLNAFIEPPNI